MYPVKQRNKKMSFKQSSLNFICFLTLKAIIKINKYTEEFILFDY